MSVELCWSVLVSWRRLDAAKLSHCTLQVWTTNFAHGQPDPQRAAAQPLGGGHHCLVVRVRPTAKNCSYCRCILSSAVYYDTRLCRLVVSPGTGSSYIAMISQMWVTSLLIPTPALATTRGSGEEDVSGVEGSLRFHNHREGSYQGILLVEIHFHIEDTMINGRKPW